MEGQYLATREELYHVQMEVKHVQAVQLSHADRLLRLEKRQADDAALKSVWNSPFPSVLSGTPQHEPVATPSGDVFEDFEDNQGQTLLGSLHLDAEDEPTRRGTSRANSVRFDVSANQGSSWAQSSRLSGEFGPARPSSGFGSHAMTERSLSHKSDGRQSSMGHSVHSVQSGRTSSLGLDTNFIIGDSHDDLPLSIPEPPPGLFILGTVPSIIRCWLNEDFSHGALLYAVVATGSQKSQVEFSLLRELGLVDQVRKNSKSRLTIRLPVYLPEAIVTQPSSRASSPGPQLPTITVQFEVCGDDNSTNAVGRSAIRVFLGSDALRAHSADVLFSQNVMTLYGDGRNRLSVPFVRPEDDKLFSNLCTTNIIPGKIELKATAPPFTPTDSRVSNGGSHTQRVSSMDDSLPPSLSSRNDFQASDPENQAGEISSTSVHSAKREHPNLEAPGEGSGAENLGHDKNTGVHEELDAASGQESERSEPAGGIWGSWRSGAAPSNDNDPNRESLVPSSYSKAGRGGRSMKVLKPSKISQPGRSTSSVRTGASYEPAPQYLSGDHRRKSQVIPLENGGSVRREQRLSVSDEKNLKDSRSTSTAKSSNPIGGASAFSWMKSEKAKSNNSTNE